jgi:hypothetical protein
VSTLRELTAESIGRITRRTLEPQIAQIEAALRSGERPLAVAPGGDSTAGVVVALTDERLLVSTGAPFAKPALDAYPLAEITGASAAAGDDAWTLHVDHASGAAVVAGMFDRDAQRFAVLLSS